MAYHWIEDKQFLSKLYSTCSDMVNRLVTRINNDGVMKVRAYMVGSGARRMILQNAKEPVDLDFNLEIISCSFALNDGRRIKEYIQQKFDEVLGDADWDDCEDSTSSLSTKYRYFAKGNHTEWKIDLCIVFADRNGWYRLIHHKTGFTFYDTYFWNKVPNSNGLEKKIQWLKENGYWQEVRDTYLEKKNMYLRRPDRNDHPSFSVYIETINEVYYAKKLHL